MTIKGASGALVVVDVSRTAGPPGVQLDARSAGDGQFAVGVFLDENHATALALALQAAVAEIQARAVGR